jgi:hypothetical protein
MSGKGGGKGRSNADEEARTPLQAVVLADSFTQARYAARAPVTAAAAAVGVAARRTRGAAPRALQRQRSSGCRVRSR